MKLISLAMTIRVKPTRDKKALEIFDIMQNKNIRCYEVEKDIFQQEDGTLRYVFLRDAQQKITALMLDYIPFATFRKAGLTETVVFNLIIIVFFLVLLLASLIFKPTGLIQFFTKKNEQKGLARTGSLIAFSTAISYILTIIIVAVNVGNDPIFKKPNLLLFQLLIIPVLLSVCMLFFCALAWIKQYYTLAGKVLYTLITISYLFFSWFLWNWQFIL